jgi:hypothetical protein
MGVLSSEMRFGVLTLSLNVAQVSAGVSAEQTFTVKGLKLNDFVALCKPTLHAGLVIGNVRVKAADQLAIQFGNMTGSPITPGAETYLLFFCRPENVATSVNI